MARNLHKEITDRILEQLRAGVVPWRQPWSGKAGNGGAFPRNAITRRAYSGVNVVLLWSRAMQSGYDRPLWLTFQQAREAGGMVRKGEKGETVVFVSKLIKKDAKTDEITSIPFLKAFTVFNVAQVDGLAIDQPKPAAPRHADARDQDAEAFIASTGARIAHGEGRAYYRPSTDSIMMPDFETFASASAYYGVAFHELTHWTGADARLARGLKQAKKFGDRAYSAEELVAELGSAFLCAEFGFDADTIEQNASYIDHWVKFLGEHETAIVSGAGQASKAVEFMRGLALADELPVAA